MIETDQQDLLAEVFSIAGGQGARHALDASGGWLAGDRVQCPGLDGHLVLYGTLSGAPMPIPRHDLMMPLARISGFFWATGWQNNRP